MTTSTTTKPTHTLAAPRKVSSDLAAAHAEALEHHEPVFVPTRHFTDDRGWSLMNQFQGVLAPEGQVNFSTQYPGVIKAWHRHQRQTDFWLCLNGHVKVGVQREHDNATWLTIIGEKNPGTLIVPPNLWHGASTVGPQPAGLLYYVTRAYDPQNPDEERRPYNALPDFPWHTRHA